MSTLRTHKDYVKSLAYAKEREQVGPLLGAFKVAAQWLTPLPRDRDVAASVLFCISALAKAQMG